MQHLLVGKSDMLRMTKDAATLVCDLTQQAQSSAAAGLRIVVDPVHHSLSMGIARAPSPDDAVITRDGARVFLSRPVASAGVVCDYRRVIRSGL